MAPERVGTATARALVVVSLLTVVAVPAWRGAEESTSYAGATLLEGFSEGLIRAGGANNLVEFNRRILSAMDRFETKLDESSPVLGATLMKIQWFQLRFGGKGNETVYPGRDEWLLFRAGYDHLVGSPFLDSGVMDRRRRATDSWRSEIQPDPRPAVIDFHRQLQTRGIDLVLLPIPTKPAIQAESLAPHVARPLENPSSRRFIAEMEDAGITVFDTAAVLHRLAQSGTPAFLRTDSHWSPAAVQWVAESLSRWLEETYGDDLGSTDEVWHATPTERAGRGDLWRLLELPRARPLYAEETVTASEITSWDGKLWSPSAEARVLILGDSFVNVYSDESLHWGRAAGFAEQLTFLLERGVDRMARNDGGSDQVRRDLARSPERLTGKRVVVYQFASRELSVGDWPLVQLAEK